MMTPCKPPTPESPDLQSQVRTAMDRIKALRDDVDRNTRELEGIASTQPVLVTICGASITIVGEAHLRLPIKQSDGAGAPPLQIVQTKTSDE